MFTLYDLLYMLLYMFHTNFDHAITVYEIQPVESFVTFIWGQRSYCKLKDYTYMTLYTCMCFIETLVMACTVSEMLAQTDTKDHKDPNWTLMTFRVIV